MQRSAILAGTLAVAALAPAAASETAQAARTDRADCPDRLEGTYSKRYRQVRHRFGRRAPGRNIRRWGVLYRGTVFDATCGELARSRRQLNQLLTVPEPVMVSRAVPPPQPPAGVQSDSNVAALPACT